MRTRGKLGGVALVALPVLAGILWAASGREVFSKSGKAVQIEVRDPLFGDTTMQTKLAPGPVLGYYVGLDLVVSAALAAAAAGLIWWWVARRRRRAARMAEGVHA